MRAYMPELIDDVQSGTLDPSPVFDMTVDLAGVPDGYAAMGKRRGPQGNDQGIVVLCGPKPV